MNKELQMSEISPAQSKKPRLGRGLGSLFGGNELETEPAPAVSRPTATESTPVASTPVMSRAPESVDETQRVWNLPIERITPNTQQPRQIFDNAHLAELTASIKASGILQPINVRRIDERNFELIAGERRWRAAQAAGLKTVPAIIRNATEEDALELAIVENVQRQDLNVIEEAEAYQLLMTRYQLTQQQVADRVGKDRATVANALRTIGLPEEVRSLIMQGSLSAGHAKVLLSLQEPQIQIELAKRTTQQGLSVRALERMVQQKKSELNNQGGHKDEDLSLGTGLKIDVSSRLVKALAEDLQKLLGTKVSIDYAQSKGKIAIHFYSDEQLNQLTEKLREAWQT